MTWYWEAFGGGEARDALIDGCRANSQLPITGGGLTIISTPVKNGTGALKMPSGGTAYAYLLDGDPIDGNNILCLEGWINHDGNPSTAYQLFRVANGTYDDGYWLEVGTDRRVRVGGNLQYDVGGNIYVVRNGSLTPWSVDVLGNGSYTHVVWILDPLTLGTDHVWMTVIIDDVVQIQADVGTWTAHLTGGSACSGRIAADGSGVDVRVDDIAGLYSADPDDAPHKAGVPIVKVAAQHPNSDTGCTTQWIRYTGTNAYYTYWDEATGNDGDTTYLAGGQAVTQESLFETAATVGMGEGAVILECAAGVGPVWSAVLRAWATGTKWAQETHCTLAADNAIPLPSTSYVGDLYPLTRTSGSWTADDLATLKAGGKGGAEVDKPPAITTLMLQWAYYDDTLTLTPTPMFPQAIII